MCQVQILSALDGIYWIAGKVAPVSGVAHVYVDVLLCTTLKDSGNLSLCLVTNTGLRFLLPLARPRLVSSFWLARPVLADSGA
jgi:hypothetical protein